VDYVDSCVPTLRMAIMFKRNDGHRQADMFGSVNELPAKSRQRLEDSWAGTFYRDFFSRIDEGLFAGLYSDQPSRPNVPVNVLVGFEVLKAGHGWTDEQAHDAVCFDLQARYALGMHRLSDQVFTLRTVYNFRRAVAEHAARTGTSLFDRVFEQVTGEQQEVYEIRSANLRMDSTQIQSNIRNLSRLQLLVEVLHRTHRMLDEADRERLAEDFAPYINESSRKYAYRMSGDQPPSHIMLIGELMSRLLTELEAKYGERDEYCMLKRVFGEHFFHGPAGVLHREDAEIGAQSLQSPDDPEATFRRKGGEGYRGYTANLTETCDEDNDQQLIVDVVVEPNSVDDGKMLADAAADLDERTDIETVYTDGGYNGAEVDKELTRLKIEQVQTGIRGRKPEALGRQDFTWEVDEEQHPVAVTCPAAQRVQIEKGRKPHTYLARFDDAVCESCPLRDQCPAQRMKRKPLRVLRFTERQVHAARRVRRSEALKASGANPRAAVEATVWSVKARFPRGRVPYRGKARVAMYIVASAMMVNIRRLATMAAKNPIGPDDVAGARVNRPITVPTTAISLCHALLRRLAARPSHMSTVGQWSPPQRRPKSPPRYDR